MATEDDRQDDVFDVSAALARVDGDRKLLRELAALFLEELPQHLEEMHNALARKDVTSLTRLAHTLKGSVGNFGSLGAREAALRLELRARHGDLGAARQAVPDLEVELNRLDEALRAWLTQKD